MARPKPIVPCVACCQPIVKGDPCGACGETEQPDPNKQVTWRLPSRGRRKASRSSE